MAGAVVVRMHRAPQLMTLGGGSGVRSLDLELESLLPDDEVPAR